MTWQAKARLYPMGIMMTNSVTSAPTAIPSLADEFAAAQIRLANSKQFQRILEQYGITGRAIVRAGGIGLTRVRKFEDCYWHPIEKARGKPRRLLLTRS